jgi:hypothetical protein
MFNPMMWLRILSEPDLASNLRFTAKKSESLINHNLKYPEKPTDWLEWKKGLVTEMNEAFKKFHIREIPPSSAS